MNQAPRALREGKESVWKPCTRSEDESSRLTTLSQRLLHESSTDNHSFMVFSDEEGGVRTTSLIAAGTARHVANNGQILLSRQKFCSNIILRFLNEDDDEWSPVYEHILQHPEEIRFQTPNEAFNALHAACLRYPPTRIIRAMLDLDSSAALQQSFHGDTPFHIASYAASEEVQAVLVRARPEAAAIPNIDGDLPLHIAARHGATPVLVELFLQAFPEAVHKPNNRNITPFWLLPRSYVKVRNLAELFEDNTEDYLDDWDRLLLFLRYSYFGKEAEYMDDDQMYDYESWIVHAAAACPSCPTDVLEFLCRMFPNQAIRYDRNGCTPLLHAIRAPVIPEPYDWEEFEDGYREQTEPAGRNRHVDNRGAAKTTLKDAAYQNQSAETTIDILLKWDPRAITYADREGRFPLAVALEMGKSWRVLQRMITAWPQVIECLDKPTGLRMFQLAALTSSDFSNIYLLTRAMPEFLVLASAKTVKRPLSTESKELPDADLPLSKRPRAQ